MGFLNISILILSQALIFSCSQLREKNPALSDLPDIVSQSVKFGQFENTDKVLIDLDDPSVDATVIVFASDTCSTCADEARYWVQEFKSSRPSNILFVHYLIGGNIDDAVDWKESLKISWNVILADQDDLYRQYCPAILTPCLVIKSNQSKEITQTYKPLRKEEIERLTGLWKN